MSEPEQDQRISSPSARQLRWQRRADPQPELPQSISALVGAKSATAMLADLRRCTPWLWVY